MKKEDKLRKAGVRLGMILFCVFVAGILILGYGGDSVVENVVREKVLQRIQVLPVGDASLADGATKVMYVMHYPHQAVPGTAYASNLSNGTAYEFYDYLDNEMTNETPFSTAFDVVVKMAVNVTHGYNVTSAAWESALFNATFHGITGYNSTTDIALTEVEIGNSSTWAYYHFYIQDADGGLGNGFQIGQGVITNYTYDFWAFE